MNSYSIRYLYNNCNLDNNNEANSDECKVYNFNTSKCIEDNQSDCLDNCECNCQEFADSRIDTIDEEPGRVFLSYKIGEDKRTFIIEITMPYGELADYWKLYEGDILVCEGRIVNKYCRPQKIDVEANNITPDVYNYRCKLINDCGQTKSETIVIDTKTEHINYPDKFKVSMYNEDLALLTWEKQGELEVYDVEINGKIYYDVTSPFGYRCDSNSIYYFRVRRTRNCILSSWSRAHSISTYPRDNNVLDRRVLVGYWNNYNDLRNIKLRGVAKGTDIINIASASFDNKASEIKFKPNNESMEEFINDIRYLQSRRQKICITIGGELDSLELNSKEQENKLFNSMQELIKLYGFNGIDISLRGGCISLNPEDKDFKNPKTPSIIHLINVLKRIVRVFGKNFILTFSPDVNYVQGGSVSYKYTTGAYLPIIYALRNELTLIYTPSRNTKAIPALDRVVYNQDTIDFHVAMAEMLLKGFNIEGDSNNHFPAIPQQKVLLGLENNIKATNCNFIMLMEKAFNTLILGDDLYEDYNIINKDGYKEIKGFVNLSLNWCDENDLRFMKEAKYYLENT